MTVFKILVACILGFACISKSPTPQIEIKISVPRIETDIEFYFDQESGKMVLSNSDFQKYFNNKSKTIFLQVDFWKKESEKFTLMRKPTNFNINKIAFSDLGFYTFIFFQEENCRIVYHFHYSDLGISPLERYVINAQKICDE
jgi:hypothetical protein